MPTSPERQRRGTPSRGCRHEAAADRIPATGKGLVSAQPETRLTWPPIVRNSRHMDGFAGFSTNIAFFPQKYDHGRLTGASAVNRGGMAHRGVSLAGPSRIDSL